MTEPRIGTRRSALARAQTATVADALSHMGHTVTIVEVTAGDRDRRTPLSRVGGQGVHVGALRDAVLRGEIDLAVHSLKDLPTKPAPDLLPPKPPHRALAAVMRFAGARIAEAVEPDLDDLPTPQRRRRLRIRGKGRRNRTVPAHTELAAALDAWLTARRTWPGAADNPAVFLNRAGGRLSARAADEIIGDIAAAAGLADLVTPDVLRHTFGTDLVRSGVDIVTVAELLGHASLDSTRIHILPTNEDLTPPSTGSPSTADDLARQPSPARHGAQQRFGFRQRGQPWRMRH